MQHFAAQGYKQGLNYLTETNFKKGLHLLKAQIVECNLNPTLSNDFWKYVPYMTKSMMNIDTKIYLIV